MRYQRTTPERIQRSLRMEVFDANFLEELRTLLHDETHFSFEEIQRRNWKAIHADNGGELDTEMDAILNWFTAQGITTMYASSKQEIDAAHDGRVLVVYLEAPNDDDLLDLQLGLWMFHTADKSDEDFGLAWTTWRDGLYFSKPLQFAILREADGYGSTTIAGPSGLIDAVKASANHGLYLWMDGPLPLENLGGKNPSTVPPHSVPLIND